MKVLNQGDFAQRAIELEMDEDEWNLWKSKDFITVAKVETTYGQAHFLLLHGNPVIVQVRPRDKNRNLHVWETPRTQREPEKEEEMLA